MIRMFAVVGVAVAALSLLPAAAQSPQPNPPNGPSRADPKACAPGERLQPGPDGPKVTTGQGENPSDKLARTDGVICPPNVDAGIEERPSESGKMPVIPPPGSPGGDPTVRPK